MKKSFASIGGLLLLVISVLVFRTIFYPFKKTFTENQPVFFEDDFTQQVNRFQGGIKIPSVSGNKKELENFIQYLGKSYPTIALQRVNQYGLLIHWKGQNSNLKPVLFLSHYDVVPAGEDSQWQEKAFSGNLNNGRIFGRGTLDMKSMLFALMDARENLEKKNFKPQRDIYFAFGHDEEVGGDEGAAELAEHFSNQNIQFEAIYDEGGIVTAPGVAGLTRDMALIGVAEKGYISAVIKVKGDGGHSSMPPANTALGVAANLMKKFEEDQFSSRIIGPMQDFLSNLAYESSFITKLAVANQWLLEPILLNKLESSPASNALVRTTTALTMSKGSDVDNVLPNFAEFVINFRILPGETVADVKKHVEEITSGEAVEVSYIGEKEASQISPTDSEGYKILTNTIQRFFPTAMISSYITVGGTDAIRYEKLSKNAYRFLPVRLTQEERAGIHNHNESISVESYKKMIHFFEEMFKAF